MSAAQPVSRANSQLPEPLRGFVMRLEGAALNYGSSVAMLPGGADAQRRLAEWDRKRQELDEYLLELLDAAGRGPATTPEQAALDAEMQWDPAEEERLLRALEPLLRPVWKQLLALLPPRTDAGIIIGAPPAKGRMWGRILAMSTNRTRVAGLAGQWVVQTLRGRA